MWLSRNGVIGAQGRTPFSNTVNFTASDVEQSWVVPTGISQIRAKMWGAAGNGNATRHGGEGGFGNFLINVTAGDTMKIRVPEGGDGNSHVAPVFGSSDSSSRHSGGYVGILNGTTWVAVVGGGGGAGNKSSEGAGAGGYESGADAELATYGGGGANTTTGGTAGSAGGAAGTHLTGGSGVGRGNGGGGWYGGGGGGVQPSPERNGGGGGGSGHSNTSHVVSSSGTQGKGSDGDRPTWTADGVDGAGGNGYMIIIY
jgi:hypothetical protein